MKLTGLDFETANSLHGSICSVGCAVLEDGVVTEKREWRKVATNFDLIHSIFRGRMQRFLTLFNLHSIL